MQGKHILRWSNEEKNEEAVTSMDEKLEDLQRADPESVPKFWPGGWKTSPYILGTFSKS